jgi:hypothetical protein
LFENFSENSLKGDLSHDTTVTSPLFSLVNTFNYVLGSWAMSAKQRNVKNGALAIEVQNKDLKI